MIKNIIKKILNFLGYDLIKIKLCMENTKKFKLQNPLNFLEVLVQLEISKTKKFNFLQVGANDGVKSDPLNKIIRKYDISGILLEPIPEIFEILENNSKKFNSLKKQKLVLENIALVPEGTYGKMSFYKFSNLNGQDNHNLSGFTTANKKKLLSIKNALRINNEISEIKVDFESVPFFLKKRSLLNLNLLVLDAEGMDIDLLMSFLNNKNYPKIIHMEILDEPCKRILTVINELEKNGYKVGGDQSDLIAYRYE